MSSRHRSLSASALVVVVGLVAATLSSCGSSSPTSAASSSSPPLSVTDAWVKAADSGMTAAFGTLVNSGAQPVTVVSASTTASPVTELHETVMKDGDMAMQPVAGGFVVPAGGSLELAPGGDHIMIMALPAPVRPGDEVAITLALADGATVPFTAVAKAYTGGAEPYHSASAAPSMSGMG